MNLIFKVGSLGVLTVVIDNVLNASGKKDIAFLVDLACVIIILALVIVDVSNLFTTLKTMFMF